MGSGRIEIASTFTATPIEASLLVSLADVGITHEVQFKLYGQMTTFMLRPDQSGVSGVVILLRLEDWLREGLKSSPADTQATTTDRELLASGTGEFVAALSALAQTVPQVWVMVCPSNGWIATRHNLRALCRTYSNVVTVRARKLPIEVLSCPRFLLNGECDDHATDRLGQMPYTQAAFDQLGAFLASEIRRTFGQANSDVSPAASDSTQFASYLAGLNVRVNMSRPARVDRAHIDRMVRTIAGFSLTGEKPYLADDEIGRMLTTSDCFLISVTDRLANYGPTGFVLFREANQELTVDAMALSCVVLGKQAEFALLSALSRYATTQGLLRIAFHYAATDRNQPMQEFLESVAERAPSGGYVVNVSDVETRISESAANAGAWTIEL